MARAPRVSQLDGVVSASRDSSMALVLDPSLSGPLGLVSEVKGLREHGVEKIYHLLPEPLQTECTSITYIIRPEVRLVEQLASQVRGLEKARPRGEAPRSYALFFLPRRSMLCEKVLTDEGVYGLLNVHELPIPLFVLEEDVISLEQPAACFRQCFHDANRSVLHACATGLVQLQAIYGRIPTVRGKGTCSQTVIALMQQMLDAVAGEDKEVGASTAAQTKRMDPPPVSEIVAAAATAAQQALRAAVASGDGDDGTEGGRVGGAVVTPESGSAGGQAVVGGRGDAECGRISELLLIDRDVDLVSPLCTELTYEGLIHAVFGIAHGYVDLDLDVDGGGKGGEGKSGSASSSGTKKLAKRELSNNDPLYAQIRNLNFGELGPLLNRLARGVSDGYEERHQAQTVSQIKDYMKRLNKLQQVRASHIVDGAEESPVAKALRSAPLAVALVGYERARVPLPGASTPRTTAAAAPLRSTSRSPRTWRWQSRFKRSPRKRAFIDDSSASRRRSVMRRARQMRRHSSRTLPPPARRYPGALLPQSLRATPHAIRVSGFHPHAQQFSMCPLASGLAVIFVDDSPAVRQVVDSPSPFAPDA